MTDFEKALESIQALYNNTEYSISECKINMNSLIGEIEIMIEALPEED